ncbi:hypothetical protein HPB52_024594 [Rhipicephalus sanguineus]|uniref:Uncharacterized protein n=1 Tax=Rhipicephalus sanguineus TaxID=34632 RepID=A0A9D4TE68_RHISA|nr:hypothetical protein HPB52_024594 [Rhipicephalus sanguineus]
MTKQGDERDENSPGSPPQGRHQSREEIHTVTNEVDVILSQQKLSRKRPRRLATTCLTARLRKPRRFRPRLC